MGAEVQEEDKGIGDSGSIAPQKTGAEPQKAGAVTLRPLGKPSDTLEEDAATRAPRDEARDGGAAARRFDAFLFDLDGTLLHTLPDLVVLTNMALRAEGYPERTEAEIKSYVGNGVRALMYQAVPSDVTEEAAERALARWMDLFPQYDNGLTRPYPGIESTLVMLRERGCKLGVVSNKFDEGVHQVMNQYLPGLFDVMHGSCEEFPRKPDPTGLLRTIDELGTVPSRVVYVGDSPIDVRTARKAGAYAVGVSWGYHAVEDFAASGDDPDLMIASAPDLVDLVDLADKPSEKGK